MTELERFAEACNYPGLLDEQAVEMHLEAYVKALKIKRTIVRLRSGWYLADYPSLERNVHTILDELLKRLLPASDARGAREALAATEALAASEALAALDALDARDAREARYANAARAASEALAARVGSREALDARAARTASTTSAVREALAASAASDANAARAASEALAALDALDARDAREARYASDASEALDARAASVSVEARGARQARLARGGLNALYALNNRSATAARAARAARAASTAREAGDASLQRFASWCIYVGNWWWSWDLAWIVTTYLGAKQLQDDHVMAWSKPLYDAFISGCWVLYWTDDTLYWVSKPTLHCEITTNGRRLHNDSGAALETDIENLYFWHGVLVPAFVVCHPDKITVNDIDEEANAEVRRVMIERFAFARGMSGMLTFMREAGAKCIDHDERFGTLWKRDMPGDEPILIVEVVNRSPEPDGSFKHYGLRVPPELRTAHQAVAWTFGKTPETYAPLMES